MVRIAGETTIDRPVPEVFDFVADERNEPAFNPRMRRVDLLTPEPVGVGSRFRAEMATGRRVTPMTIEFTGYDRPRRLGSMTRTAGMDIHGALTFEPVPKDPGRPPAGPGG